MKQQLSASDKMGTTANSSHSTSTSRSKDIPRTQSANGVFSISKARPKPDRTEASNAPTRANTTRSTLPNRLKPSADHTGPPIGREMEDSKNLGRPVSRVVEKADLQKRLVATEGLVKDLQCEVSGLKAQLEKLQSINSELESQNKQLVVNLSAAKMKIISLENHDQIPAFGLNNAKKVIANKSDRFKVRKEISRADDDETLGPVESESGFKAIEIQPKNSMTKPFPPPPPPPPPALARPNTTQKASALVNLYHSLTKSNGARDQLRSRNHVASNAHNSIVGELQNRSAHLLAIKADVETKGDFIKHLIEKVQSTTYVDMEDVLSFADWLDRELSTLADERGVLKHFKWPERKADALREAAFEYRDRKLLLLEVSSFEEDDASLPCEVSLKKIENLLDKLERSVHGLIKLRGMTMISYKEYMIPTDWMLESGMVRKMKVASVMLAKVYMKRVSVESPRHSERELLLVQGVRFAYRAHQFAGGFDPETMCAFEELRERVHPQHVRGI